MGNVERTAEDFWRDVFTRTEMRQSPVEIGAVPEDPEVSAAIIENTGKPSEGLLIGLPARWMWAGRNRKEPPCPVQGHTPGATPVLKEDAEGSAYLILCFLLILSTVHTIFAK